MLKLPKKYFSICEFRIIFIEKIIRRVINIVGVKNGHDEVNIQISVKISMNVFTKNNLREDYFYEELFGEILH